MVTVDESSIQRLAIPVELVSVSVAGRRLRSCALSVSTVNYAFATSRDIAGKSLQ